MSTREQHEYFFVIKLKSKSRTILLSFIVCFLFLLGCKTGNEGATSAAQHDENKELKEKPLNQTSHTDTSAIDDNKMESRVAYSHSFSLLESFSRDWVSGVAGGGKGTEYTFRLLINTNEKLDFDSVWVNGNALKLYLANNSKTVSNHPVTFAKGDTISVRASYAENAKAAKTGAPLHYNGQALVSYLLGGNMHYLEINSIEKRPTLLGQ